MAGLQPPLMSTNSPAEMDSSEKSRESATRDFFRVEPRLWRETDWSWAPGWASAGFVVLDRSLALALPMSRKMWTTGGSSSGPGLG